jgi:hypothetical protein
MNSTGWTDRRGRGMVWCRERRGVGWGVVFALAGRRDVSPYKTPRDASRKAQRCGGGGLQEPRTDGDQSSRR